MHSQRRIPDDLGIRFLNPRGLLLIGSCELDEDEQRDFALIRRDNLSPSSDFHGKDMGCTVKGLMPVFTAIGMTAQLSLLHHLSPPMELLVVAFCVNRYRIPRKLVHGSVDIRDEITSVNHAVLPVTDGPRAARGICAIELPHSLSAWPLTTKV